MYAWVRYVLATATGVGIVLRKMGNTVSPTVELKLDGEKYTLTTSSTFKTSAITFQLGVEFDEETLDGRKVKSICTMDGDTLIQEQKGDKPSTIIREFKADELIAICFGSRLAISLSAIDISFHRYKN
uniref:Lipocalin/cytosolic fatty-acid binding domain-containing protein n=1 Tax=Glossina brevipalpis TaxID=37001 RepID=A0A1A9X470_9MUSC